MLAERVVEDLQPGEAAPAGEAGIGQQAAGFVQISAQLVHAGVAGDLGRDQAVGGEFASAENVAGDAFAIDRQSECAANLRIIQRRNLCI